MRSLNKPVFYLGTLLCLLGAASAATAALTVIFDNGQAKSLSVFLGPLETAKAENDQPYSERKQLGAADLQSLLPIRSPGFTPGKLKSRTHNVPFARPFFLIGSDEWSQSWLVQHRKALKDLGAVGMLVEATSLEDLRAIASLAEGLPITPASGSDIAKAIGISHYPVGITTERIWQ
jgi:integrating conjugative element protein (TIGR03765 family)